MTSLQLAVLATYGQVEHRAVYHYCRSILVQQPFTGGLENLSLLFAKNLRSYCALGNSAPSLRGVLPSDRSRKGDVTRLRVFLTRFVRLHGMLFDWSSRMHRDLVSAPSSMESASDRNRLAPTGAEPPLSAEAQTDELMAVLQGVLEELDVLLGSALLDDSMLTELLVLCLFSVQYAVAQEDQLLMHALSYSSEETERFVGALPRTVTESLGLIVLYGFINRYFCFLSTWLVWRLTSAQSGRQDALARDRQQRQRRRATVTAHKAVADACHVL